MTEPELKELIREVIPELQRNVESQEMHRTLEKIYPLAHRWPLSSMTIVPELEQLEKSTALLRKCKLAVS